MFHDFHPIHGGENGPCNGKGIMSYGHYEYDEWSKCSRSDFEKTFHEQNWGAWCLDDISGKNCILILFVVLRSLNIYTKRGSIEIRNIFSVPGGCSINNAGYSCKIPFSYHGKEYYECTKDGGYEPWCYDVRGFGNWAYCSNCAKSM